MEYMAWRLQRPLITISCHDDLTASDLIGRYLVTGGETVWMDGSLARAVACTSAVTLSLTDDPEMIASLDGLGGSLF